MSVTSANSVSTSINSGERPAKSDRLLSLQALRAAAALLVVWVHAIDAAEQFPAFPHQSDFFHLENFGACGVDIFFVISGFIVSLVAARAATQAHVGGWIAAKRFLKRRITRIFPLYWLLTCAIVLEGELGRFKVDWPSVAWLPTLFLLPSRHYPADFPIHVLGWSLMFEIYFYVVLGVFLVWTPRFILRNTSIFFCCMAALGAIIGIHRPMLVIWMNPLVLEFVFGCMIGMLFARQKNPTQGPANISNSGRWFLVLGAVLLASTIFTGYRNASESPTIMAGDDCWLRVAIWGIPAALIVGGALFWNPAMRSLPARWMVFLGDASYSIYLCTLPARSVVEHFWRYFGKLGPDMGVFLCTVFCTCVGIFCYLLAERPLMRAFHNWEKPIPFSVPSGASN